MEFPLRWLHGGLSTTCHTSSYQVRKSYYDLDKLGKNQIPGKLSTCTNAKCGNFINNKHNPYYLWFIILINLVDQTNISRSRMPCPPVGRVWLSVLRPAAVFRQVITGAGHSGHRPAGALPRLGWWPHLARLGPGHCRPGHCKPAQSKPGHCKPAESKPGQSKPGWLLETRRWTGPAMAHNCLQILDDILDNFL